MTATAHLPGIFILCLLSSFILWLTYLKTNIAAWIGVAWSFNFTLVVLYLMMAYASYNPIALGLGFMYLFWSLRLSGHLLSRLSNSGEDPRFEKLKKHWKNKVFTKMLAAFGAQSVLTVLFSIPLFVLWSDPNADFTFLRKVAAILWFIAVWCEGRADRQLDRFKRSAGSGKVCSEGFWKFSRHPNYFFELMIWLSFALYTLESPNGLVAFLCPVLFAFLIIKITGIPPAEEQALSTKGNEYKRYQENTSMLFPRLPRLVMNAKKK